MPALQRVVVTGSAGRVGRAVVKELHGRGHHVIGYDLRPTPGLPAEQSVIASGDASLVEAARGASCLIHLAATPDDANYPRGQPPDDADNFLSELVPNNIVATYKAMEAARTLGIPRVVLTSTGQVIDGHLKAGNYPVTPESPPRPRYLYACTKVFLEALGQVYAKEHGMQVLAVRLGWCPRDTGQVNEIAGGELFQDVFISPGDVGRFYAAAVEAPTLPTYAIVYATSRFTHKLRYDLSDSQRLLNWSPREQWPAGASEF
jgi:nucleoside-diphosphate-sugar epimerase